MEVQRQLSLTHSAQQPDSMPTTSPTAQSNSWASEATIGLEEEPRRRKERNNALFQFYMYTTFTILQNFSSNNFYVYIIILCICHCVKSVLSIFIGCVMMMMMVWPKK